MKIAHNPSIVTILWILGAMLRLTCQVEKASAGASSDEVIADGPTAYWRLGETSGTTAADAMNAYNGTYVGAILNQTGLIAYLSGTVATGGQVLRTWGSPNKALTIFETGAALLSGARASCLRWRSLAKRQPTLNLATILISF